MSTEYLHTIIHDERAARLFAEADYARLVRRNRPARRWFRRRRSSAEPVPAPPMATVGDDVSAAVEITRRADPSGHADPDGSPAPSPGSWVPRPRDGRPSHAGADSGSVSSHASRSADRDETARPAGAATTTGQATGTKH